MKKSNKYEDNESHLGFLGKNFMDFGHGHGFPAGRERIKVIKKLFIALVLSILVTGCAAFEPLADREAKYGKEAPVIQASFAAQSVKYGDDWKIYLKAYDPDGDIKHIICQLDRGGRGGTQSPSYTRVKEENQKELSGYLYWYVDPKIGYSKETVMNIQIQDMAGHLSPLVTFPITFRDSGQQEPPPQGLFLEKDLGPIMIIIKPPATGP